MEANYLFEKGKQLYQNALKTEDDLKDFVSEGTVVTSIQNNELILEQEQNNDDTHFVYWNKKHFPDNIVIEWNFRPLAEPGLCMLFFAASGKGGRDLFDTSLPARSGKYPEYHSGEINALHLSYFRRKWEEERAFHTCNLRKSAGFHLVAQGADPIPSVVDVNQNYQMKLIYYKGIVQFSINNLVVLEWEDKDPSTGPVLQTGKIGFRQMAPMKAAYSRLRISEAHLIHRMKRGEKDE
ncbi:DUF1961 family protein [Marinilactibacillus sp. GCM10026970]|uniref:DUF1961 family protein n=1 Tax=Marinilactibacillus sp. GCM10026970 TaxID=3252642 RepID=UPI003607C611